jgi:hypothetical protein
MGAKEVTARVERALTEALKNGFHEYFQKFYKCWQKRVIAQGNYSKGNAVQINIMLFISEQ